MIEEMSSSVVIHRSKKERYSAFYIAARLNSVDPGYRSIAHMGPRSGLEALKERKISYNKQRFNATNGAAGQANRPREIRFASKTEDRKS